MNLAERASSMAASDMVDDCASSTAAGWLGWLSRASRRSTARAILVILSSSSRRFLALSRIAPVGAWLLPLLFPPPLPLDDFWPCLSATVLFDV